jgi:hypothetical protein
MKNYLCAILVSICFLGCRQPEPLVPSLGQKAEDIKRLKQEKANEVGNAVALACKKAAIYSYQYEHLDDEADHSAEARKYVKDQCREAYEKAVELMDKRLS